MRMCCLDGFPVRELQRWVAGESLAAECWQALADWELRDVLRAKAFGVTVDNAIATVQARSHLLRSLYPAFRDLCQALFSSEDEGNPLAMLWSLWLPLAMDLTAQRKQLNRPLVQGILGAQGTGKTTLGKILKLILEHAGYRTLSLSLDDVYKTRAERLQLQQQDPRLVWRGPPGTHDVSLAIAVLDRLRQPAPGQTIAVPRFDKSAFGGAGDRTQPDKVADIDIVLFEGWFVGLRPIDPTEFDRAPPPIFTEADRCFARDMNVNLQEYSPLWERLDRLMVLYASDYRFSQQWRWQAERRAIAAGRAGMTKAEIAHFVEYFWKALHPELFIQPLLSNPQQSDPQPGNLAIELNRDHVPVAIYCPQDRQTSF